MSDKERNCLEYALKNLNQRSFKSFKSKLRSCELPPACRYIPRSELESLNHEDTTDYIIRYYTKKHAPNIITRVLEEINERQASIDLQEELKKDNQLQCRVTLNELQSQLGMGDYMNSKLTLNDMRRIGRDSMKDSEPQDIQDLPWHYLRKLMALNNSARSTHFIKSNLRLQGNTNKDQLSESVNINTENDGPCSISLHPLDVLCVLLNCSDHFLQQEIVTKMSMCQFAVPLLLPTGDGSNCTFMLWAMRDIVKRWRPHSLVDSRGFTEENVVNITMPTFSFVRLGKNKLSKSKILNQVLSSAQHEFFVHYDMKGGNIERKISDGLVEISWYFPTRSKCCDIFPVPIAVTNLRGDLESNWTQFIFLTRVSSAVFIFTESIGEREFRLLSNCENKDTEYNFIITPSPGKDITTETIQILQKRISVSKNIYTIIKKKTDNDTILVEKIQSRISFFINNSPKRITIENMESNASIQTNGLGIGVDEHPLECSNAREYAGKITKGIHYVPEYKREAMCLQRDLWKKISEIEKEICRMRQRGSKNTQEYLNQLKHQLTSLQEKQYRHNPPNSILLFITCFVNFSHIEKHYFLKWLKCDLDSLVRNNLLVFTEEYNEKYKHPQNNMEELKKLAQTISDSCLGTEHFIREMVQLYEAECARINKTHRAYSRLPGIAADLLLGGFPLELVDGDASNIPMRWITDVLTELDTKTGGQCRMRVITVLGGLGTGKSTLLNTMFGLQFPVASGRCTRGAFMTLIKVKENVQEELGCDFILAIDTEGLKALELASLEDSHEHDNELATLVVGLSDITIINMAMENSAETKNTLQIVVHVLMRMKDKGKELKCLFVHQKVSEVSSYEKNVRERFSEQLDEITNIAAKRENKDGFTKFSDVTDYAPEKDNWYIPSRWHGVPPMAAVNTVYSESVSDLKQYLLEIMRIHISAIRSFNIKEFIIWLNSLWNEVKHEKFIFSFRNSLVAKAYNKLSVQFSQWEWEFTKAVHSWVNNTETLIRNQSADTLQTEALEMYTNELHGVLIAEGRKISELLETFFKTNSEHVLIKKYKKSFISCIKYLKDDLERSATSRCMKALQAPNVKTQIQCHQKRIQSEIINFLEIWQKRNQRLGDRELEEEFETMWRTFISDLQIESLQRLDISQSMLHHLHRNMKHKGPEIDEILLGLKALDEYGDTTFQMQKKYIDFSLSSFTQVRHYISQDCPDIVLQLALSLIEICDQYITNKVSTSSDYDNTYGQELLQMVDNRLRNKGRKTIPFSLIFELDIKIVILRKASRRFQKMHDDFIQEKHPNSCLEKSKGQYFTSFLSMYQVKDQSQQKVKQFCDLGLRPALTEYIHRHLGKEIVDDILGSSDSLIFNSRCCFQVTALQSLLKTEKVYNFIGYINSYEIFAESWILRYIYDKYKESSQLEMLQTKILSHIIKKIKDILRCEQCLESPNIVKYLENICEKLKCELVIPQSQMDLVVFGNHSDVAQFRSDLQTNVSETEKQILSEIQCLGIESVLYKATLKPEHELLKKVMGCGKRCPFCKVPCEAGGSGHTEHFTSIHRPLGLVGYRNEQSNVLLTNICCTGVALGKTFKNDDTGGKFHTFKDYHLIYPDWSIDPDPNTESSDYWKYIFVKFNEQFAEEYNAKPAVLPKAWKRIDREEALQSLKEVFNKK
ncbi:up-regulator of cell proliferation-like [Pelobates cultripes]|uniref:Up-regulator of cell proliferation-like n=1 Tax=Pelobates cultripes TaxID=61616 RepID=A0AAD1WET2_PELCU|nr:up-regulator of cell proliferation-like [Pelobates cultripes]